MRPVPVIGALLPGLFFCAAHALAQAAPPVADGSVRSIRQTGLTARTGK
jgi:hypothetical protein